MKFGIKLLENFQKQALQEICSDLIYMRLKIKSESWWERKCDLERMVWKRPESTMTGCSESPFTSNLQMDLGLLPFGGERPEQFSVMSAPLTHWSEAAVWFDEWKCSRLTPDPWRDLKSNVPTVLPCNQRCSLSFHLWSCWPQKNAASFFTSSLSEIQKSVQRKSLPQMWREQQEVSAPLVVATCQLLWL